MAVGIGLIIFSMFLLSTHDETGLRAQEPTVKPPMTIYSYKTIIPPVIDGNIVEFQGADSVYFCHASAPAVDYGFAYVLWNEKYFYIAFKVNNRNIRAWSTMENILPKMWENEDVIEVLIDCNNDKSQRMEKDDIGYHINLLGTILDAGGRKYKGNPHSDKDGGVIFAAKYVGTLNDSTDLDKGYSCEMAIPWSEINRNPEIGMIMGIDFCVNDHSDIDGSYRYYDWCRQKRFQVPSKFGKVVLKDKAK